MGASDISRSPDPIVQWPRTPPFHGGNTGSNPVRVAIYFHRYYGPVHLVRVADGLTVVGAPVVYACRLSSGPGGDVLLNEAAFEKLSAAYSKFFYIGEQTLDIKHEGSILVYNVKPGNSRLHPKDPEWVLQKADQRDSAGISQRRVSSKEPVAAPKPVLKS